MNRALTASVAATLFFCAAVAAFASNPDVIKASHHDVSLPFSQLASQAGGPPFPGGRDYRAGTILRVPHPSRGRFPGHAKGGTDASTCPLSRLYGQVTTSVSVSLPSGVDALVGDVPQPTKNFKSEQLGGV